MRSDPCAHPRVPAHDKNYNALLVETMDPASRDRLKQIIVETGAFQHSPQKPFKLASGRESPVYFDMRLLCSDPEGLTLAATMLYEMAREAGARAVGGLEAGAIPIATAVSLISHIRGGATPTMTSFYVRKTPKEHGTRREIEGVATSPVVILDDVVTSGGSALRAVRAVRAAGLECAGVFCILFRGTSQDMDVMEREGPFRWVFTQSDFAASNQT